MSHTHPRPQAKQVNLLMHRSFLAVSILVAASGLTPSAVFADAIQMAPPTPGVCLFSRPAAIGASHAGQAGTQRMQQLLTGVNAELQPQQQQLVADSKALQAQKASLPAAQFQERASALQTRIQSFQQLEQMRNAQLAQTKAQVEQYIGQTIDPVLDAVTVEHHCSVVIERSAAYRFNAAMDLTDQVRVGLDQRLPSVQFNLVTPEAVQNHH